MFTGIIEEIGKVYAVKFCGSSASFTFKAPQTAQKLKKGESMAVNGVCLTISGAERDLLKVEAVEETLKKTNLSFLKAGERVNLEPALLASGRLSGHFLTGHVDGLGAVRKRVPKGGGLEMEIYIPAPLKKYLAFKGSIALDGVSLSLASLNHEAFTVALIPYTLKNSTLGERQVGDRLNIEVDILAKYAERILSEKQMDLEIDEELLEKIGFMVKDNLALWN